MNRFMMQFSFAGVVRCNLTPLIQIVLAGWSFSKIVSAGFIIAEFNAGGKEGCWVLRSFAQFDFPFCAKRY